MKLLSPEPIADPVSEIVAAGRFESTIFCRSMLRAPWGFSVEARDVASFLFVEAGRCVLDVPDVVSSLALAKGDLVILPHGHRHIVRDRPGSRVTRLETLVETFPLDHKLQLSNAGRGDATSLICGAFAFEDRSAVPFLAALPPLLRVASEGRGWLGLTPQLIARGPEQGRDGGGAIPSHLRPPLLF